MYQPQSAQLQRPRAHSRQAATETVHHALQHLTGKQASRDRLWPIIKRETLEIEDHAENGRAESVSSEGAKREGVEGSVQLHAEVEAEQAA